MYYSCSSSTNNNRLIGGTLKFNAHYNLYSNNMHLQQHINNDCLRIIMRNTVTNATPV